MQVSFESLNNKYYRIRLGHKFSGRCLLVKERFCGWAFIVMENNGKNNNAASLDRDWFRWLPFCIR